MFAIKTNNLPKPYGFREVSFKIAVSVRVGITDDLIVVNTEDTHVFLDVNVILRVDHRILVNDDNSEIQNLGILLFHVGCFKMRG